MKSYQTLAACVLFLCLVALLNQCSSPYLHVEDYPASFATLKESSTICKVTPVLYPVRLQPHDMKGWQFYNCALWKSNKGMRISSTGASPERWLKLPENPQYRQLRFL